MRGRYSSSTARSITTNSDGPSASMGRIGGNDCASGMKHYVPVMFSNARGLKSGYTSVATRPLPPNRLSTRGAGWQSLPAYFRGRRHLGLGAGHGQLNSAPEKVNLRK